MNDEYKKVTEATSGQPAAFSASPTSYAGRDPQISLPQSGQVINPVQTTAALADSSAALDQPMPVQPALDDYLRQPDPTPRLRRFYDHHRHVALAVSGAVVLILLAGVAGLFQYQHHRSQQAAEVSVHGDSSAYQQLQVPQTPEKGYVVAVNGQLQVTGATTLQALTVQDNETVAGNLTVNGTTALGAVTANDLHADHLYVNGQSVITGPLSGNGSGLSSVNAAQLEGYTATQLLSSANQHAQQLVAAAQLQGQTSTTPIDTSNFATLNANNTFTANNVFSSPVTFNGTTNMMGLTAFGLLSTFNADAAFNANVTVQGYLSAQDTTVTTLHATTIMQNGYQVCDTSGNCADMNPTPASTFVQGGNSFAATAVLGTTDNNALVLRTNNIDRLTIAANGSVAVAGSLAASSLTGDGSGVTNVNATQLDGHDGSYYLDGDNMTGTVDDNNLSANVTLQGNAFNGANQLVQLTATGALPALDGGNLTNVNAALLQGYAASYFKNASNLSSGTVADARLSTNVALKNGSNSFTGTNTFAAITATSILQNGNAVCDASGNCVGLGNSVTTSSAGTAGTLALFTDSGSIANSLVSQASTTVTVAGTLVATALQGDGSLITNLNASNLASGTVSVARGGTGTSSLIGNGLLYGNGTGAIGATAAGTTGQCLVGNTSAAPSWQDCTSVADGAAPGGAAAGDLSGSYPNPTVVGLNGVSLSVSGLTDGNVLVYNGTSWANTAISGDMTVTAGGAATIAANAVTTTKIANAAVTNAKLQNSSLTVMAGSNLTGGGTVALGNSITLDVSDTPTFGGLVTANGGLTVSGAVTIVGGAAGIVVMNSSGVLSSASTVDRNSAFLTGQTSVANGGTGSNTAAGARTNLGAAARGANNDITSLTALTSIVNGDVTYNVPTATTGVYSLCTTAGNCAGSGNGATVSSGGTTNTIAMFTGSQAIANSILSQNGAGDTITVAGTLSASYLQGSGANVTNLNAANLTTGTVSVARGGTGAGTFTGYGIIYGNGTSALAATAAGATGQCLQGNTGSAPSWASCTSLAAGTTPGGTAGGDLSGTYPNPTVIKLNGTPLSVSGLASGNFLLYNGTNWINKSLTGDLSVTGTGAATIAAGAVTNAKLQNSSLTVAAGTNLTGGGPVSLGGSITLTVVDAPTFGGMLTAAGGLQVTGGNLSATGTINTNSAYAINGDTVLQTLSGDGLAVGVNALSSQTTGYGNLAIGHNALASTTDQGSSIAIGIGTLQNANAYGNIAIGINALNSTTDEGSNVAVGIGVLQYANAYGNTALGASAMHEGTTGGSNVAVGISTLGSNTTGYGNTAVGANALGNNSNGSNNTAFGLDAGRSSAGNDIWGNALFGYQAGMSLQSGANNNTIIGTSAGTSLTTGANNILIGDGVQAFSATTNNELNIGNTIFGDLWNGSVAVQALNNGVSTFQVENSSAAAILTVDTVNSLVTVANFNVSGGASVGGNLGVGGTVNALAVNSSTMGTGELDATTVHSTTVGVGEVDAGSIYQNGYQVCDTSSNCTNYAAASGSANYIQNGTGLQSASFNIDGRTGAQSFSVNNALNDLTNNSPWYGLGTSNVAVGGDTHGAVQVAGYFGMLLQTAGGQATLTGGGNFGIGTITPGSKLQVVQSAASGVIGAPSGTTMQVTSGGNNYITFENSADNGTYAGLVFNDNNTGGYITNGNAGAGDSLNLGGYSAINLQVGTAGLNAKNTVLQVTSNGLNLNGGSLACTNGDGWLRVNDGTACGTVQSQGVYFGNSLVRTDYALQVGGGGSAFNATMTGTSIAGTLTVGSTLTIADFGTTGSANLRVGDDTFFTDVDQPNTLGLYGNSNNAIATLRLGNNTANYIQGNSSSGLVLGNNTTVNGSITANYVTANSGGYFGDEVDVDGVLFANSSASVYGSLQVSGSRGWQLYTDDSGVSIFDSSVGNAAPQYWQATTSLDTGISYGSSVTANGYVYAEAVHDTEIDYAKLNANGSLGSWNTAANLPSSVSGQFTSVTANGYLYIIGGYSNGYSSSVYYAKLNADGSLGSWNTAAYLPNARVAATSVTANGYVYVMGGYDGTGHGYADTVYYAKLNADGSLGSWGTTTTLSNGRFMSSSAVANGYMYIIGGDDDYQGLVQYAKLNSNGTIGAWATAANYLPDDRRRSTSVVSNGYLYTIGGEDPDGNYTNTTYYAQLNANGSIGSWQTDYSLLQDGDYTAVVSNGYAYAISNDQNVDVYYAHLGSVLKVDGSLDLVGMQGGNLADANGDASTGSVGGSITAGNITAVGGLQIQGQANFAGSAAFMSNINVGGSAAVNGLTVTSSQASAYVATINNTNTGTATKGLLIQLGVANASRTTSNYFIGFAGSGGTVAGKIQGGANAVAYTTSAADYAEYFRANPSDLPQAGDLVTIDTTQPNGVRRAASGDPIAGVISTNPGFIGNGPICQKDDDNCDANYAKYNVLVSLTGQVPLKTNNEGGEIHVGDPIGTSSIPGVATRATGRNIIGYALTTPDANGMIQILINPTNDDPSQDLQAGTITAQTLNLTGSAMISGDLNVSGNTTLSGLTVRGSATIAGNLKVAGSLNVASITVNGHIITAGNAPTLALGQALTGVTGAAVTGGGTDTAGTVTITAGDQAAAAGVLANVTFAQSYDTPPKIVISGDTGKSAKLGAYVVRTATGFQIVADDPLQQGTTYSFDYMVMGAPGQ